MAISIAWAPDAAKVSPRARRRIGLSGERQAAVSRMPRVDANTGQVTLRGEFRNPKQELLPGMYVRVLIEQGRDPDALSVPPQAIQRNGSGGSEVYLVKDDNRIVAQPVRTGNLVDGQWLITEGLEPGPARRGRGLPEIRRGRRREAQRMERCARDWRHCDPRSIRSGGRSAGPSRRRCAKSRLEDGFRSCRKLRRGMSTFLLMVRRRECAVSNHVASSFETRPSGRSSG